MADNWIELIHWWWYWLWPATGYNRAGPPPGGGPLLGATANDIWCLRTFDISWNFSISWHLTLKFQSAYIHWTLEKDLGGQTRAEWKLSKWKWLEDPWNFVKIENPFGSSWHGWFVVGSNNVISKKVEFLNTLKIQQWENLYFWVLIYHALLLQVLILRNTFGKLYPPHAVGAKHDCWLLFS